MQLTGAQIVEKKIVTGVVVAGVQQQGVDLRVKNIRRVNDNESGYIPETGNTLKPVTEEVSPDNGKTYILKSGYYEVEFIEGCDIPKDATLQIKTRSSHVRCGAICHSGQFDGGFHTDNMGCFLHVILPISIDKGARIAQALVFESYPVSENHMYNGQWQGDKQRDSK